MSARRAYLLLLGSALLLSCSRSRPAIRTVLLISIDTLRADRVQAVHKIGDLSERKGDEAARVATQWLDQHKGRPFFFFVHFYDPHEPYEPPEPFASEWEGHPYEGEVAFADQGVGLVIEKL